MNHEFSLSDLPTELASVLRDYDVDNSGSVSVAELVAGAQLMRQQAKKNKLMTKIVVALTVLLVLLLAGNFGLVWAVVVYNTPTTVHSNVLTVKNSGEPVQVSSADFYYDSNGLLQLRKAPAQVPMDWAGSSAVYYDGSGAADSAVRRRLLQQDPDPALNLTTPDIVTTITPDDAATSNIPLSVDMQTTQFTPTCSFASPDFYTNSSYFFTGTCTFTKLVQMRTLTLPMMSSKTSAQVGGNIMDAAAWKTGALTQYLGCYKSSASTAGTFSGTTLSGATTLSNCEKLALSGVGYNYFGFTGASTGNGICYACGWSSSTCKPLSPGLAPATGPGACSATAGVRVYQLTQSPNRVKTSSPGAMANSPVPIDGVMPALPAWSFVTLAVTRVDYVKNVFRDASNSVTACQANLLRFYVEPMIASGSVTSVNGGTSSFIDICLTPMTSSKLGSTWIGNYTVHSTGKSSTFSHSDGTPAYYDRPSVVTAASLSTWAGPNWTSTDFQSVLSYYCANCPSGPYIDYSNLQYDANLFELPCTKKGISWRYRDLYSNQGCPAWDPSNPAGQAACRWSYAYSTWYGGPLGPNYCITTMDTFTPDEPVYTFANQMSFAWPTGRDLNLLTKTSATSAPGDSGVPPLYSYATSATTATSGRPLWLDYFNTTNEAQIAVSQFPWFISGNISAAISPAVSAGGSGRHLLQAAYKQVVKINNKEYMNIGDCASTSMVKNYWNGDATNPASCTYSTCTLDMKAPFGSTPKICRCYGNQYCHSGAPFCSADVGCFSSSSTSSTAGSMTAG